MSVYATAYVWEHSTRKGTELLLMLAIADIAHRNGVAFPSVKTLARYIRMSGRNTIRALQNLERSGELSIRKNAGPKGTNLFQIRMNTTLPLFAEGGEKLPTEGGDKLSPDKMSGDTQGQKGVTPRVKRGDTAMSPEPPVTKNLTINKGPLSADMFEKAFSKFPKRAGNNPRLRAEKAWSARIRAGVSPELMLAGVVRYAAFCASTGKVGTEAVMMAATFFGADKVYEQEFSVPPQPQSKIEKPWWESVKGVEERALELGLKWPGAHLEPFPEFAKRVKQNAEREVAA